jgi:hypothetical protein
MKKIVFIISLIILIIVPAQAQEIYIKENNERFKISLIVENICNQEQENIFKIEKENYTTKSNSTTIKYNTTCNKKTTSIEKSINKYSKTKTGYCLFKDTKIQNISLKHNNKSFLWNIETECNSTIEKETNETNQNDTKELYEIDEEKTTNNKTNQTNVTINNLDVVELNNLTNQDINIVHTTTNETVCDTINQLEINQEIFENDEQITIDFENIQEPFEITYWIETIDGTIIKNKRTTTNLNTKKHTFKSISTNQGAYVYAQINTTCKQELLQKLILLMSENTETKDETVSETIIEIEELEVNEQNKLNAKIQLQRGESSSSVVYVYLKDREGSIVDTQKITLKNKHSTVEMTTSFYLQNLSEGSLEIQGLKQTKSKPFIIEKQNSFEFIRAYTKQKYYENNITWYVRINNIEPLKILIKEGENIIEYFVNEIGEKTHSINIPYQGNTIQTTIKNQNQIIQVQHELNITRKNSIQKKEQNTTALMQATIENNTQIQVNKISKINITTDEEEHTRTIIQEHKKSLYALLGVIMASSTYFLLKEQ